MGDCAVVFCLTDLLSSDGSIHIGLLNALTGLPEDGQQDDHLAPGFPAADPSGGAIERDPQFVHVISVFQFLDVIAIRHTTGDQIVVYVPHDPLVVAVWQIEQPCLHLRLQTDLVYHINDIYQGC